MFLKLLLGLISLCPLTVCGRYVYHFIDENKTWTEAQQFCRDHYTDLVTIRNMAEVNRTCPKTDCSNAWIGLINKNQTNPCDRQWHWSQPGYVFDNTTANWVPNTTVDSGVNCGYAKKEIDGNLYWNNYGCYNSGNKTICYNAKNESKYVVITQAMTWPEAQRYCRQDYTDLVSGHDQLNDSSLASIIQNWQGDQKFWIGLFRDPWAWSDSSQTFFRNWAHQSEVNDYNEFICYNQTKCAKLRHDNLWDFVSCSQTNPFICYDGDFVLVNQTLTWEEALLFCRRNYCDLAMMMNPNEQKEVMKKAKMADTDFVWVGLHYVGFFEEWVWVNGKWVSSSDPNWENTKPNDCSVSGAMQRGRGNKWVKKPSDKLYNFVCSIHCVWPKP